jgi:hypothetical protein
MDRDVTNTGGAGKADGQETDSKGRLIRPVTTISS